VVGFRCGKVENLGGRMRRMKKRGPNVLFDLNDLLFFLTVVVCTSLHVFQCQPFTKIRVLYEYDLHSYELFLFSSNLYD